MSEFKHTVLYANIHRGSIQGSENTYKQYSVEEDIGVIYQALIQKGLKVRIIKYLDSHDEEVSLEEVDPASNDNDQGGYYLEVDDLSECDTLTLKGWNDFLAELGGTVNPS